VSLHKFGPFYIDLDEILWVKKFTPELLPANVVRQENVGGVRIGIGQSEITIYEDEPGYEEFTSWLENQAEAA
jgi:hypothetical protein